MGFKLFFFQILVNLLFCFTSGVVSTILAKEHRSNGPVMPFNTPITHNHFFAGSHQLYSKNNWQNEIRNFKKEHQNFGQKFGNKRTDCTNYSNLTTTRENISRMPMHRHQWGRTMPLTAHQVAKMMLQRHKLKKARFSSSEAAPVNMHKFDIGKSRLNRTAMDNGETGESQQKGEDQRSKGHGLASLYPSPPAFPGHALPVAKSNRQQNSPIRPKPMGKSVSADSLVGQLSGANFRQSPTRIWRTSSLDNEQQQQKSMKKDGGLASRLMNDMPDIDFAKLKGKAKSNCKWLK